jgi:hypothetical protein
MVARERVQSRVHLRTEGSSRQMSQSDRQRHFAAIAIRDDGTRVLVRLPQSVEVSLLGKLEVIVLELIGLITGSRWEPGDRRR